MADSAPSTADVTKFIERWSASGGSEMGNAQLFVTELCDLLVLPRPDPSREANERNDYVFERRVDFKHADGSVTPGRIDLYKRDCFVLEAKQSAKRQTTKANLNQLDLIPEDARQLKAGPAKRGTRNWDTVMVAARKQAEDYARALPVEHGYPPFLMVVDVGHVIEVYADFSGQGKNYAHFPDRQSYRIGLEDLTNAEVRDRLKAIWTEPHILDPAKRSAEVTRDIAARLAKIAKSLEAKKHAPGEVAEFLMRCLFTMFAEDVGLLPKDSFTDLLERLKATPKNFAPALESLWQVMDKGGYAPHLNQTLKRFNGSLFKSHKAIALDGEEIHELWVAAKRDWRDVEPAIFGTLLERALDTRERSKLGAHYTPRAYVERLVIPTIIEPLRSDWAEVKALAADLRSEGNDKGALDAVKAFHHQLCVTRVLDPACGTGNFLYVALELMKRLEGEVLETLDELGEDAPKFLMKGETVDPHQFFGLELNPRAVAIADLVLWIGYLKWQLKTGGPEAIAEPVLDAYGTIREQDAILAYDARALRRDERGQPITVWDGHTMKDHPVTGLPVPDESARVETYTYQNPRPAKWPEVEFIVGNPPFIGGKDMRAELGDGYAEAAWKARPHMPGGADFVMHFWDHAAEELLAKKTALRRFGFITTNSITQTFSRRVIERHLNAKTPLSLLFAVPDHPWLKAADKAAVRIAMTVAGKGERPGVLAEVIAEEGLNTDAPKVELENREGRIQSNLKIGAEVNSSVSLMSNDLISSPGVKLHGAGFIVSPKTAKSLGLGKVKDLDKYILEYRNGRDIAQRPRGVMVIDLLGLDSDEVRSRFPAVYQHVVEHVKPERDQNNRATYRDNWWIFGEPRRELRPVLIDLSRYITTVETSKHRFFQFLDASIRPDNMLVNIGVDRPCVLSILSSRQHIVWALAAGAWLGVGNDARYSKTRTFDPFPFPAFDELDKDLLMRLNDLGERLDAFRKERLAAHDFLTMTGMYNVLERLRELDAGADVPPLSDKEKDIHEAGLISVLKEIHDDIDRATFEAYGWGDLIPALVGRPGATTPSPHKSAEQEAAEEELLTRLVALNRERAAEEARGHVRWLRPEFQIPKLGHKVAKPDSDAQYEADIALPELEEKPAWPAKDGLEQIRVVRDILALVATPATSDAVSAAFAGRNTQKRKERVARVLETLAATGAARSGEVEGVTRYFVPK